MGKCMSYDEDIKNMESSIVPWNGLAEKICSAQFSILIPFCHKITFIVQTDSLSIISKLCKQEKMN